MGHVLLPWSPVVPILAILSALGVVATLPLVTWVRLATWLVIGLAIFFTYARSRARRVIVERSGRSGAQ